MKGCRWLLALSLSALYPSHGVAQASPKKPKLVVQITVDGLRGDLLDRYRHNFAKDGFNRLINNGVYYKNAHYQHANTETIVGHTSLATGAPPAVHGMIGNIWYDDADGRVVYNIEDAQYALLTADAGVDKKTEIDSTQAAANSTGRSPKNILVSTISDEIKLASNGKAKSFAVSVKDRGAVALAGHSGKAFWFDKATAQFVTSNYYFDEYPEWVIEFNAEQRPGGYANTQWQLAKKVTDYSLPEIVQQSRTDLAGFGNQFPHPYGTADDKYFTTKLTLSPAGDELTKDFAIAMLNHEQLGGDQYTDYLSVSFSSNDYVVHLFGPSSREAEDNLIRLDRTLGKLLNAIDKQVGLNNTLVVLSADHGVPESADIAHDIGISHAHYFELDNLISEKLKTRLKQQFGVSKDIIQSYTHPYLYLNDDVIQHKRLDITVIEQLIVSELTAQKGIYAAFSSENLKNNRIIPSRIANLVANNHNLTRSGDIYVVFNERGYINDFDGLTVSSTHGSPWRHDTHVPIIVSGMKIGKEVVYREVSPYDIAPTIAHYVGTSLPSGTTGTPLLDVFED